MMLLPGLISLAIPALSAAELSLVSFDKKFDSLIASKKPELVGEGYSWTEGPLWVDSLKGVLFTDVEEAVVRLYQEGDVTEFLLESGGVALGDGGRKEVGANGLALHPSKEDSHLYLAQHGLRQVARLDISKVSEDGTVPASAFQAIATEFNGTSLNSPNDLAFTCDGDLLFTDPPYGLTPKGGEDKDELSDLGFFGVYHVAAKALKDPKSLPASPTLLYQHISRPNGIGVSPDGKWLYVGESGNDMRWLAFEIKSTKPFTVGEPMLLVDTEERKTATETEDGGSVDGLDIASDGTIFASGPSGVYVIAPPKGYPKAVPSSDEREVTAAGEPINKTLGSKVLGKIEIGVPVSNAHIGADGYLYMTGTESLWRVKLSSSVKPASCSKALR